MSIDISASPFHSFSECFQESHYLPHLGLYCIILFSNKELMLLSVGKGYGGQSIQESSGAGGVRGEHPVVPLLPPAGDFRQVCLCP